MEVSIPFQQILMKFFITVWTEYHFASSVSIIFAEVFQHPPNERIERKVMIYDQNGSD